MFIKNMENPYMFIKNMENPYVFIKKSYFFIAINNLV